MYSGRIISLMIAAIERSELKQYALSCLKTYSVAVKLLLKQIKIFKKAMNTHMKR